MAVTTQELYDWLNNNWGNKTNFSEGNGVPTQPPTTDFVIYYDKANKEIYTWNALEQEWVEGLGGRGGSFEGVQLTDNTPIVLENSKSYIFDGSGISGKPMTIDFTTFSEVGQELKITDNGFINQTTTTTIKSEDGVTINGISEDIIFNFENGTISIICVKIVKDADENITSVECKIPTYGLSEQTTTTSAIEFLNTTSILHAKQYMADCSNGVITLTVDSGFEKGQSFSVWDYNNSCETTGLVVDFTTNGYNINSAVDNFAFDINGSRCKFIYVDELVGFKVLYNQF